MRKRCKRKVWATNINPVAHAIAGAAISDGRSLDKLRLCELSAIDAMTKGMGTTEDWRWLADVVNIGHSNPVQVNDFVQTLSECLNVKPTIELLPMQVSDVPLTCASDDKLRNMIGERPHTNLRDGLSEMVQWLEKWNPV
jgi:nucleoside-diphosphate-sugar epimerase